MLGDPLDSIIEVYRHPGVFRDLKWIWFPTTFLLRAGLHSDLRLLKMQLFSKMAQTR